jgi:hypothetical protein
MGDRREAAGEHWARFTNQDPGVSAHLLRGSGIDGRKVSYSRLPSDEGRRARRHDNERCYILFTLYDDPPRPGDDIPSRHQRLARETKTFDIRHSPRRHLPNGLRHGTRLTRSAWKVEGKK